MIGLGSALYFPTSIPGLVFRFEGWKCVGYQTGPTKLKLPRTDAGCPELPKQLVIDNEFKVRIVTYLRISSLPI